MISAKTKKILCLKFIFFYLVGSHILLYSANSNQEKQEWIIAVSEFTTEHLNSAYENFKTIVPEMFLIELDTGAKRHITYEEKKLRAMAEASAKKLKLIKERAKLIEQRDAIFLSTDIEAQKIKNEKKLNNNIKKKEEEIYLSDIDLTIAANQFYPDELPKNITLWKNGTSLYKTPDYKNISAALQRDNISALISGTIKDVSGYMIITVTVTTGILGMETYNFSDAGKFDDVEKIVQNLSAQIYSTIQNTKEIKLNFDITPKTAKLYIDNRQIYDITKPITIREGSYQINASAEGYTEAAQTITATGHSEYMLKIDLKKIDTVQIGFNFKNKNPAVFYKTQYTATMPGIITIPQIKSIMEFEEKDVSTFGLIDGKRLSGADYVHNMVINLNKKNVKQSIDLQRKILYWSLGAVYISLPITMIIGNNYKENLTLFNEGKLPLTQETAKKIYNLQTAYNVLQGISITLGINYFIQLIIYLVKADKALPKNIKVNKEEPKYKSPKTTEVRTRNNTSKEQL